MVSREFVVGHSSAAGRRLDCAQHARRRAQLVEYRAPERLQSSALRRPQVIGKRKGAEFRERVAETGQRLLESHGPRGQGGLSAELGPHHSQWVDQEPATIRLVRCAVGRHKPRALARRQLVLFGRSEDSLLVLDTDRSQSAGQAGPDVAGAELLLGDRSQT